MSRYKTLAAAALVAMMAAGVARAEGTDPVVAKVGGQEIRQSELDLAITSLDPQLQRMPDEQKRAAALSAVIDVKLLVKDAEKEGLQNDATFKQRVAFLTERELHNAFFKKHVVDAVTKEEVKARYDKEIAAIPAQEEVKARHILVKTEDEAKAIIKELDAGKSFVELAKAKSTDPNKDDGGDLGYFTKGRMVPEFETAAFALEKGSYTKMPVKTQFGFHVILVEDKRPQAPPTLEQVEPQVRQLVMRDKYLALLDTAKKATGVEISDPALKKAYEDAGKARQGQ
ncbi:MULTISPECIES: peptidylprolyl isomerase [Sinorhizobium]|uniref:Parvulin-like PPIase n=2 Tax=Sinorhizobium TaxID=28105 RepID=A0A2S3YQD1_9HYPH|nr:MULTISPECIES: peptidylprolyl isomerase [Sinorhizobium]AUX77645.1 peptidylprolyl cis-trans isomerase PpiC-type protein [Sinorhizobium fredii]PDT34250.1 peptidylprolyl isomerase [Sinorhizobium sp. FG01]PDT48666.1 peptidylprolyl isomerase [Sinorhizobium sp. NG07B]POH33064.1 peptidylprolyl isomerase [Sinorhizobium americanum]POH33380.1 peptidylprolyl isomerase [Sinorhizobium americanum]